MSVAVALAVLAFVDCTMCGFRTAAGRNGLLEKRAYYARALGRAALAGALLVGVHAALVLGLCVGAPGSWSSFVDAGRMLVVVYGIFATLIFLAFGFYFAPIGDFRVLTNVIVFGPLTLARRAVIVGGMVAAAWRVADPRVTAVAVSATLTMLAFEPLLGRAYADRWRRLVR